MIPITRPCMDEREEEAACRAIRSGWITQGPEVARFERAFASAVNAPFACAVSSCTAALHLALLALGVSEGDHVITVSHSFIATANAIRYCGATPVFVDIQRSSYNIDPEKLEGSITPRTRAILCVHQRGMPCDMAAILDIAARHGLAVVEDAACAAGSTILHNAGGNRWGGHMATSPVSPSPPEGHHHREVACCPRPPRLRRLVPAPEAALHERSRHRRHGSREVVFESTPARLQLSQTDLAAAIGSVQLERLPRSSPDAARR